MTWEQIAWLTAVLFLAPAIQAAVGFGAGLFAIPVLVWAGLTLPQATGAVMPGVLAQTLWNCYRVRAQLPWRATLPLFIWRGLALPIGVWIMGLISTDMTLAKRVIGVFLLVALIVRVLFQPKPRAQIGAAWTAVAGILSGLGAGTVGMGGPPASLWVLAHDWPPLVQRSALWLTFLLLIPLHTGLLIYRFGDPLIIAMAGATALIPVSLLGAVVGANLGERMNRKQLTFVMLAMLFIIAIRSIMASG